MARFGLSLLDLRLGIRMLTRYPVLTIIGTASLAFAIAVGATAFAFISLMLWPRLPLPDGDRIVRVQLYDQASARPEYRATADFLRWRGGLSTLTDFAAGRDMRRNLRMGNGIVEPVSVEEVTASMFTMARVAPIAGRVLTDDDARVGASPVMVLGERIWRERYAADPDIVGKSLLLSDTPTTVVGVLPAAFRFPSIFEVWQPLAIDETVAPRVGTGLDIWARLKSGVTRTQANIELAALAARTASDWPATHAHLRAVVESPAVSKMKEPGERAAIASFNLGIGLIVLLVSGNVALLMFARAATRESEILVRIARGFGAVTLSTLVLALSGIYAVMSFAVSRRTREIGIRVALGSQQWRVVLTILRRQLIHLSIGPAWAGYSPSGSPVPTESRLA